MEILISFVFVKLFSSTESSLIVEAIYVMTLSHHRSIVLGKGFDKMLLLQRPNGANGNVGQKEINSIVFLRKSNQAA